MHAADKKLNEMNRLSDMGHFPPLVNAGATLNILLTLALTWYLVPRHPEPYAPILWIALVLTVNLLPVALLRLTITPATTYRRLADMDFVHDQHKFSDWVYVAASANMAFWVLSAWALFSIRPTRSTLLATLAIAAIVTFSPVLLRRSASSAS
jgi:hypothetical protein